MASVIRTAFVFTRFIESVFICGPVLSVSGFLLRFIESAFICGPILSVSGFFHRFINAAVIAVPVISTVGLITAAVFIEVIIDLIRFPAVVISDRFLDIEIFIQVIIDFGGPVISIAIE